MEKKFLGYDHLAEREFMHVPLWGIQVIFLYCMERLQCFKCGVIVEEVPWGFGKSPIPPKLYIIYMHLVLLPTILSLLTSIYLTPITYFLLG